MELEAVALEAVPPAGATAGATAAAVAAPIAGALLWLAAAEARGPVLQQGGVLRLPLPPRVIAVFLPRLQACVEALHHLACLHPQNYFYITLA